MNAEETLRRRMDALRADREVWQDRLDVLGAALTERLLEQRAAVSAAEGKRVLDGRWRGAALEGM